MGRGFMQRLTVRCSLLLKHRNLPAALAGHVNGSLVAGVGVAGDAHARIDGQDAGQAGGGRNCAVGDDDLSGV